jgi:deoxyribonuclease-4
MAANKILIGRHISINQGFVMSANISKKFGYGIFQIFLNSPTNTWNKSTKIREALVELKLRIDTYDQFMVIHGAYTINLCHPISTPRFKSSIQNLVSDLKSSVILGDRCLGVIIHMGKNIKENNISDKQALENYVQGIQIALDSTKDATLILETGAGQGTEVGSLIDGLAYIYKKLSSEYKSRVKFCIDTCHIWAVGYDISTPGGVDDFFKKFDKAIGLDKIACVHFNDSRAPLGAKIDRHADLSYGKIGADGLKALALFAVEHNFPLIMETPLDAVNMATNRDVDELDEKNLLESWIM